MNEPSITEEQVKAYMLAKLAEMHAKVPGYISLTIDASNGLAGAKLSISAYSEHCGHRRKDNLDEAIQEVYEATGGKSESDLLRQQARMLLDKAIQLETAA